ncbi:protein kinase [Candidatus Poribacteria bacterium]|nr:protein kinase [Candidatus Poribacteria bacterium]
MMLQQGTQLANRYQIERLLATGGTGTVYKAFDTKLKRPVAIKLFRTDSQAYGREAEIAASLSHPNIVALHDFVRSEPHAYLIMEYINGETLAEVLGRVDELRKKNICSDDIEKDEVSIG